MHNRRSEHSEACPKVRKVPQSVNSWLKNQRPELDCDLDADVGNLPFSKVLKAGELSVGFKMPSMEKYNRKGDPTNHINVYMTRFQGNIPTVKCQNFHTALVSNEKRWYNKMKLGNIKRWPQLKHKFINDFIHNRTMIVDISHFHNIRQTEGESMKGYLKWFINVITKSRTSLMTRSGLGQMLVDDGSTVNILFGSAIDQMDIDHEPTAIF
ncbi:Uncharacterized protein Adt_23290 [Abeliophyllum distichum]|uniref:Retrotransposon gag domain-containing protein n=1 Tax=Abeliophyllum distichum TaxID=126358 RepID=A0ABD1SAF5_9LAMI